MTSPRETAPADADEARRQLRWLVYALLITISTGGMLGRLLALDSVDVKALENYLYEQGRRNWYKSRPFLSANDRSRWCTVRALVEHGTYAIDDVIAEPGWDTIDMVKHRDAAGVPRLYSSKPPLMATLLAGPYWVIHRLTGATLGTHPYEIGRLLLFLFQVGPLVVYFVLMAALIERYGQTDFGRVFAMAVATCGTFLTTFAITLNNHLPAAVCALGAVYVGLRIWHDGQRAWWYFALAGFLAALTVAFELPALSFCGLLGLALLVRFPRPTLLAGTPAALLVAAAYLGTNYAAHNTFKPPYAMRLKGDAFQQDNWEGKNWYNYTYERGGKTYTSYWATPQGIDAGESDLGVYIFHSLIGHHGIFSLTPVWLLMLVGLGMLAANRGDPLAPLGAMTLILSGVCFAFYMSPTADYNYGGMTSGPRWMFWFTPLWTLCLLPAADWLGKFRAGRAICLGLLALSVISVVYPLWNPWTHPWLYDWWLYRHQTPE